MTRLPIIAIALIGALLTSCGTMKKTMTKVSQPVKSLAKSTKKIGNPLKKVSNPVKNLAKLNKHDLRAFKLRDLRGGTPPIVEVRAEDLKKMKSGQDRFLAYNRSKRTKRYSHSSGGGGVLSVPQDFDPGSLPTGDGLPTFGLLPPLLPGTGTSVEATNSGTSLPTPPPVPTLPDELTDPEKTSD